MSDDTSPGVLGIATLKWLQAENDNWADRVLGREPIITDDDYEMLA